MRWPGCLHVVLLVVVRVKALVMVVVRVVDVRSMLAVVECGCVYLCHRFNSSNDGGSPP